MMKIKWNEPDSKEWHSRAQARITPPPPPHTHLIHTCTPGRLWEVWLLDRVKPQRVPVLAGQVLKQTTDRFESASALLLSSEMRG